MSDLTPFKERALGVLADAGEKGHTGRSFALALWPDSPAWRRRTRGSDAHGGGNAMAGTMPMKGARVARELNYLGLCSITYTSSNQPIFTISHQGTKTLEALKDADGGREER